MGGDDPLNKGQSEIDLFEIFGFAAGRPWNAGTHYRDNMLRTVRPSVALSTQDVDTAAFHVYAMDWQPTYLRFYRDNVMIGQLQGADATWFNISMSIRLNYAMDAAWFPIERRSSAATPSPLRMEVDYVRVYRRRP